MDSQTLVDDQIEAAARVIDRLKQLMPLTAAFWVKPADGRRWTLYLVTDWADSLNDSDRWFAFSMAMRQATAGEHVWGDFGLGYQLVRPDSRIAQAVFDLHRQYPKQIPMRYNALMLGDMPIDDAYLYPLPAPAVVPAAA